MATLRLPVPSGYGRGGQDDSVFFPCREERHGSSRATSRSAAPAEALAEAPAVALGRGLAAWPPSACVGDDGTWVNFLDAVPNTDDDTTCTPVSHDQTARFPPEIGSPALSWDEAPLPVRQSLLDSIANGMARLWPSAPSARRGPDAEDFPLPVQRRSRSWRGARPEATRAPRGAVAGGTWLAADTEALLVEVRVAFGKLFMEAVDSEEQATQSPPATGRGEEVGAQGKAAGCGASLLTEMLRSQLADRLIGCHEAIASELTSVETTLFNAFVDMDTSFRGTFMVRDDHLRTVLGDLLAASERVEACLAELEDRATADGELDFVDLLDAFTRESVVDKGWSLRISLRSGLLHFVAGAGAGPARMELQRMKELRARAAKVPTAALVAAIAAYQRSFVLTCSWRCEQRLAQLLPPMGGDCDDSSGSTSWPRQELTRALLATLSAIHADLSPTERVLWEFLGTADENFDASFTRREAAAAMDQLFRHSIGTGPNCAFAAEAARDGEAFEHLQRLREECHQQFLEDLFAGSREEVSLPDVLRLWWDMPEEYRNAAGLVVPPALLHRSMQAEPEEMFREHLLCSALRPDVARHALRGHARAFAHLRALAARRAIEGLHSPSPTASGTGEGSGATSESGAAAQDAG